ncbi:hypothetical protein M5E88_04235 [Akkermansia muciniphila]|nr:hypothetical protein M5E88_04235 [Akkermansia muciniphila]
MIAVSAGFCIFCPAGDCRFIQDKAWPGGAGDRGAGNAGGIFSHSWLQPEKPLIGAVWRVVVVPAVKAGSLMFLPIILAIQSSVPFPRNFLEG